MLLICSPPATSRGWSGFVTDGVSQRPGKRVHHSGRGNPIFSELPLIWTLAGPAYEELRKDSETSAQTYYAPATPAMTAITVRCDGMAKPALGAGDDWREIAITLIDPVGELGSASCRRSCVGTAR